MLGREIAAPDHGQGGVEFLDAATGGDRVVELRAGHDRHAKDGRAGLADRAVERGDWVAFQVTVDNQVVMLALKQRAQGEERHGQHGLALSVAGGVVEN